MLYGEKGSRRLIDRGSLAYNLIYSNKKKERDRAQLLLLEVWVNRHFQAGSLLIAISLSINLLKLASKQAALDFRKEGKLKSRRLALRSPSFQPVSLSAEGLYQPPLPDAAHSIKILMSVRSKLSCAR